MASKNKPAILRVYEQGGCYSLNGGNEMIELAKTLLIACVPAVLSGITSFILAKSQAKSEIKKLQLGNQHDIEKLMEQHKVDVDAIREQHRLEMEAKEKDHQHKLEIIQQEHENELIRKERELENTTKYNAAGSILTGLLNDMMGGVLNSPEVQGEITKQIIGGIQTAPNDN